METKEKNFDYNEIPLGYYDVISMHKLGMRSFWHNQKFRRVLDCFVGGQESILDIGCFSGTFLGMVPENIFARQVGVDILKDQIDYANNRYATNYREFKYFEEIKNFDSLPNDSFDCVSIIEVIEHLSESEIRNLISIANRKLKKGGKLVITTPNYISAWPILEIVLNKVSNVKYQEQHITKFNIVNLKNKLRKILVDSDSNYTFDFVTTTHSISPYIALFSYNLAEKLSSKVKHKNWHFPFGSLLLTVLTKE